VAKKKHVATRKAKKSAKKARSGKPARAEHPRKRGEIRKPASVLPEVVLKPLKVEPPVRERYFLTVENIRGDTAIGDLLVSFPRTREVLVRMGLRLEAEDAGDIYMTLDAFSAMNGLKTQSLLEELVEVAKEPSPQQPMAQVVGPTVA
jgi:hypothetical protein